MPNFGGSDSQGIGGTGCDLVNRRKRRRRFNRRSMDASTVSDPVQLLTQLKAAHTQHNNQNRMGSRYGSEVARRQARQRAAVAAAGAYQDALRSNGQKGEACEAALRAYLEISPNDTDASDQVVRAIILAAADLTSEP